MKKGVTLAIVGLLVMTGCRTGTDGIPSGIERDDLDRLLEIICDRQPTPEPDAPDAPEQPQEGAQDIPAGVQWLHLSIADWPVTTTLDAGLNGGTLRLGYDKANTWPVMRQRAGDGGPMVGNVWAIFQHKGKTYAGVWDYMRQGQQSKGKGQVKGADGHLPGPASDWKPSKGDRVGFMVSGDVRGGERNVRERSQVDWVIWE